MSIAEVGVTDSSVKLGQSAALNGPAKALGTGMKKGAKAYFDHINANGGVNGRKIELITLDDKYEPKKATINTNKLINDEKVFALFGEVGTPTSKVAVPIAKAAKVPFLMPFTGAGFLRDTNANPTIINFRGSYDAETEALVEYLTTEKGVKKIAIFYQNDGYGKAGLSGVNKAMKKRSMQLSAKGTYKRNTLAIKKGLKTIEKAGADAIIIIGAYKPASTFIQQAKKGALKDAYFCNISFVGSKALIKALKNKTDKVIISQVVPLPWDASNAAVKEYQDVFKKANPSEDFGFVTLEGFLSAKLTVKGIEKAGKDLTRDSLIKGLESVGSDALDGFSISLSSNDHQAMQNIYITCFVR